MQKYYFRMEVVKLDLGFLAVKFLGIVSIILALGFSVCFLAIIGYNTYLKYQDKHKKIEVHAENPNFKNDDR